jgi:hypothetical protein
VKPLLNSGSAGTGDTGNALYGRTADRELASATEWAYARAYNTSDQRAADLPLWTHLYNPVS